jgi:hypothetical protein
MERYELLTQPKASSTLRVRMTEKSRHYCFGGGLLTVESPFIATQKMFTLSLAVSWKLRGPLTRVALVRV